MNTLYGRARELRVVEGFVDDVVRSTGRALALVGDPGIGKTALLDAMRSRADAARVLSTRAVESVQMLPFAVLGALLYPLRARLAELPAARSAALSSAIESGAAPNLDVQIVAAAAFNLLTLAAADQPLILVVDDAQWLDSASALALGFASLRIADESLGILLAWRPEGAPGPLAHVDTLTVSRLDPTSARRLLIDSSPMPLHEAMVDELIMLTAGNPLAILETPTLLTPEQAAGTERLAHPLEPGEATRAAFRRRIDALPAQSRMALVVIAAGEGDPPSVAAALRSFAIGSEALNAAEAARLLRRDVNPTLAHPIVRSVAYHEAPAAVRRSAHRALAEALPLGGLRRAWHMADAVLGPNEAAAAALDAAAGGQASQSRLAEASLAFARAAELSPDPLRRVERLIRGARAAMFAGRFEPARALAEQARDEARDPLHRAAAQHTLGQLWSGWDDRPIGEAIALLEHEAETVASEHPDEAASMLADAAFAANASGDVGHAMMLAELALAVAGDGATEACELEMRLIVAYHSIETLRRPVTEDVALLLAHAGAIDAPQLGASQYGTLIDRALIHLDRFDLLSTAINKRIADAREHAALLPLALLLVQRAEGEFQTGDWLLAEADLAEALTLVAAPSLLTAFVYACMARLDAVRGRRAACDAATRRALDSASQTNAAGVRHYLAVVHAEAPLAQAEFELARDRFEHVSELEAMSGVMHPAFLSWRPGLIECCAKLGDTQGAAEHGSVLAAAAERLPTPTLCAFAADARARIAGAGEFEPLYQQALTWHARGGRRFMRARTLLAYGERLRRERRRRDARRLLRAAVTAFEELPSEPWAERARVELRATGETVGPRTEDRRNQLTASELQVARLASAGKSNREIAVNLFVSPKTVEKHMTSIYRKLGIASRHELWTTTNGVDR